MGRDNVQLHAHDWTIATKTYAERPQLAEFFNILAVDTHNDVEFVIAVEAKNYPIYGMMSHPETQNIRKFGGDNKALEGKVNNEVTDAINYYFSHLLTREASKNLNTNYFEDKEQGKRMTFKNAPLGFTMMYTSWMLTYGFWN